MTLPPIVLPPMRLQIIPEVDSGALTRACVQIRDAVHAAALEGLQAAVQEISGPDDDGAAADGADAASDPDDAAGDGGAPQFATGGIIHDPAKG